MNEDCPFCTIVRREAPAQIVWDWGDCLAFTPLNPVTPGHTLVVPTAHVPDALAHPTIAGLVFGRAAEWASRQVGTWSGFNLITSAGAVATQTVFHLHVHVVPRRLDDGLALPWTDQQAAGA